MWNPTPQSPTIADAQSGYQVHGVPVNPALLQVQNPAANAIKALVAEVTAVMRQQERNDIANRILAIDNAPKAQAVNPETGQVDPNYHPPAGTPDAQLHQAMVEQNLRLGAPTTPGQAPNGGGWKELEVRDAVMKHLQDRQAIEQAAADAQQHARFVESEITRNNRPPLAKAYRPPEMIQTPTGPKTVAQANYDRLSAPDPEKPDSIENLSRDLSALTGHSYADWANAVNKHMGRDIPEQKGWFHDTPAQHIDDGNFYATFPVYDKDGNLDRSKTRQVSIPGDLYQKMLERRHALDHPSKPTVPAQPAIPTPQSGATDEAQQIKADFAAGTLTRAEAIQKLQALGFH